MMWIYRVVRTLSNPLGDRIKAIRLEKGMTLEQFGECFNPKASKGLIRNWETGSNSPNKTRLKHIAEMAGMTVSELLIESECTSLGSEIKRLRREKTFLTQEELAENIGFSRTYLADTENDRNIPSITFLNEVAEGLGVSKLYLYKAAGYLDETDILELVDENKRLREALETIESKTMSRFLSKEDMAKSLQWIAYKALKGGENNEFK